jgi:hypothetical protein
MPLNWQSWPGTKKTTSTTASIDESDDEVDDDDDDESGGDEGVDDSDEDEDTSEEKEKYLWRETKRTRLKITLRVSPRHMRSFEVLNLRRFLHKLFCITFSKRG